MVMLCRKRVEETKGDGMTSRMVEAKTGCTIPTFIPPPPAPLETSRLQVLTLSTANTHIYDRRDIDSALSTLISYTFDLDCHRFTFATFLHSPKHNPSLNPPYPANPANYERHEQGIPSLQGKGLKAFWRLSMLYMLL